MAEMMPEFGAKVYDEHYDKDANILAQANVSMAPKHKDTENMEKLKWYERQRETLLRTYGTR
jgi:hypothetical protein